MPWRIREEGRSQDLSPKGQEVFEDRGPGSCGEELENVQPRWSLGPTQGAKPCAQRASLRALFDEWASLKTFS